VSSAFARSAQQVGRLIQRSRQERGLNQTELAQLAGLRQEMISKLSTVCDVLAALGLEMTIAPRTRSSSADIEDIF
jgi:HTH-type transcriptional regulator / antitoxin HipB